MGDQTFESVLDPSVDDRTFSSLEESDNIEFVYKHLFSGEACAALCLQEDDCVAFVFTEYEPRLCVGLNSQGNGHSQGDGIQQRNAELPEEWGLSKNRQIFVSYWYDN